MIGGAGVGDFTKYKIVCQKSPTSNRDQTRLFCVRDQDPIRKVLKPPALLTPVAFPSISFSPSCVGCERLGRYVVGSVIIEEEGRMKNKKTMGFKQTFTYNL